MTNFAVILVAAGRSSRFNTKPVGLDQSSLKKKPFVLLKGRAVWLHSAQLFSGRKDVKQIILVVSPEDREEVERKFTGDLSFHQIEVVSGGAERVDSVANGLKMVRDDIDYIAIHDAVRPCVTLGTVEKVFDAAVQYGGAIPAAPLVGTIKKATIESESERSEMEQLRDRLGFVSSSGDGKKRVFIRETVPRDELWEAQTPQVFRKGLFLDAFAKRGKTPVTDDAMLFEQAGHQVVIVPSDITNIKITTSFDLQLAEKFLELQGRKSKPAFGDLF